MKNLKEPIYWQVRVTAIEQVHQNAHNDADRFKLVHGQVRDKVRLHILNQVRDHLHQRIG